MHGLPHGTYRVAHGVTSPAGFLRAQVGKMAASEAEQCPELCLKIYHTELAGPPVMLKSAVAAG